MTGLELRTYIKAWITQVLITEEGETDLPIISSHQNAPSPDEPYITIQYNGGRSKTGRASKPDVYFNDEDENDPLNGTRLLVSDWGIEIEIRETNGEGDRLRLLIDSLDREDIHNDYFVANKIVHYTNGNILPVPRLNQEDWIKESMVEMQLGSAEGTRETTSWIDTVQYEGTIGGTQE